MNTTDELVAAVGEHLGFSSWLAIDQDRINLFADATGDHQWIHVDPARAAAGPFGQPIAHGYLTLSLLPVLVSEVVDYAGWNTKVNYGSNKIRFPGSVPVGSRVRAGVQLVDVRETAAGIQVTNQVTVDVEGSDRPALVAETVTLLVT